MKPSNANRQVLRLTTLCRALPPLLLLGCSLGAAPAADLAPSLSPANREWVTAMLANRASLQQAEPGGGIQFTQSPWFTTGPLKAKAFSDALFPERGVNLEATARDRKRWRMQNYREGMVNSIRAGNSTSTYFYRTLVAKAGGKLEISLGSDDGMEFWFNGEKVKSEDVPRGAGPDQNIVSVNVRPGTNTVLLKIYNRTGDCGFYYVAGNSARGITAQLNQKYPREMRLFDKYAKLDDWLQNLDNTSIEQKAIGLIMKGLRGVEAERKKLEQLVQKRQTPPDAARVAESASCGWHSGPSSSNSPAQNSRPST